eukprot:scaffold3111_cov332-Prasinococcus_capsulatus_cf.AAC.8
MRLAWRRAVRVQAAVIVPTLVPGLRTKHVRMVAAAKHHMLAVTCSGEVFSWGSNREGQLGYNSVDTQVVPRRIPGITKVCSVAASNKHSAAIGAAGARPRAASDDELDFVRECVGIYWLCWHRPQVNYTLGAATPAGSWATARRPPRAPHRIPGA